MTQQYTIHKFIKTQYSDDAPYSAIQVEETEWFSPYPDLLIDRCFELAKEFSAGYLLQHRFSDSLENGPFPGAELYKSGAKDYTMAWLVVPVIENLNLLG